MSKKVAGERSDTNLARSVLRFAPADKISVEELDVEANVYIADVFFDFKSREERFKPYLILSGHANSIHGNFQNDITDIVFNDDEQNIHPVQAPQCVFEYDPSRDEAALLCESGFYEGLEPPTIFKNQTFSFPVKAKIYHIEPLNPEVDSPITFVEITGRYNVGINALTSGYANREDYEERHKILGLIHTDYIEPVPLPEDEIEENIDYDHVIDLGDDYIVAREDETVEEEVPVDDIELSEEDLALLQKFSVIKDAADIRVEKQAAVIESVVKTDEDDNVEDEVENSDDTYNDNDDIDSNIFFTGTVPTSPVRATPNVTIFDDDSTSDDFSMGED